MRWDLGLEGLAVLIALSLGLGALAWLVFRGRHGVWPPVIATIGFLIAGALVSEGLFGWATGAELQPNIGGLSFDETFLAFAAAVLVVLVARYLDGRVSVTRPR